MTERRFSRMREFLRGAIRLHVLHHAASGELNGAWMAEEFGPPRVQGEPWHPVPDAARMEEEGLLVSRREVRDGRALRMYQATKQGRACLAEGHAVLSELAGELLGQAPRRERSRRSS